MQEGKVRIALLISQDQLVGRFNILVHTETQQLIFAKVFFLSLKTLCLECFQTESEANFHFVGRCLFNPNNKKTFEHEPKARKHNRQSRICVSDSSLVVAWTQQLSATSKPSLPPFLDIHEVKNISFPVKHHSTKKKKKNTRWRGRVYNLLLQKGKGWGARIRINKVFRAD